MKRTAVLTTAAVLLTGLALAQGPRAMQPPRATVEARQPVVAQTMRERAIANQTARHQFATARQNVRQGPSALAGRLQGVVASAIGLSQDEIHALKAEGASLGSIAADRGVELASLEATYLAARAGAIEQLVEDEAITALRAEQMLARGPEAFAALIAREGCAEGQNVTGEPLFAHRLAEARGPQAQRQEPQGAAFGQARGPRARW